MFDTLSKGQQEALYADEADLEMKAVDLGVARYRELRAEGDPSTFTPEQQLIVQCMKTLVPGIEKTQRDVRNGKAMRGVTHWGMPLLSLHPEKLALITLVTAINLAGPDQTYTAITREIALAVKAERALALVKQNAPDVFKEMTKRVKKWDRKAIQRLKIKSQANDRAWSNATTTHVGARLAELLIQWTPCFEHRVVFEEGRRWGVLLMKEEFRAKLDSQHSEYELVRPFHLPMVVPPRKWAETPDLSTVESPRNPMGSKGGYLFLKSELMKSGDGHDMTHTPDAPLVKRAVNIIEATPYRINRRTLDVVEALWASGGGVAGLPKQALSEQELRQEILSYRPEDIDTNEEAKLEFKRKAAALHSNEAHLHSARKSVNNKLMVARKMRKYEAIWFPGELDWRGRWYPKPCDLHPQADDLGRGLLEFAEAKPLGPEGFKWLTIHLANCIGYDKCPFAERIAQAWHLFGVIEQWASNPLAFTGWQDTEDPWRTLAAAFEWAEAAKLPESERPKFLSRVPVAVDGSCNGLQHFSAIGRDPVGGRAVNLIPGDRPEDIYEKVAAEVNRRIEEDCAQCPQPPAPSFAEVFSGEAFIPGGALSSSSVASWWRGRVSRKTVKRAVMTGPYGVTKQGIRTQFIKDGHCEGAECLATTKLKTDGTIVKVSGKNLAAEYMKDVVYEAMGKVAVSARQLMDWLREVARITAAANKPLEWVTPAGLTVKQEYLVSSTRRVLTHLQEIWLREAHPGRFINAQKQERGSAPNTIHSFDASHLFLTAVAFRLALADVPYVCLGPVHDSYSTHAGNTEILSRVIREEFVRMYTEHDVLAEFKAKVEADTGLTLPPLPAVGTLDLNEVLKSPYFFH